MVVLEEKIPEGSYILRGFFNEPNETDIDLVVFLENLGAGVAEISAAKGNLTPELNVLIGLKAYDLGFRILQFHALKGTKVTRWAEYVSSDNNFDYYRIDLKEAIDKL